MVEKKPINFLAQYCNQNTLDSIKNYLKPFFSYCNVNANLQFISFSYENDREFLNKK